MKIHVDRLREEGFSEEEVQLFQNELNELDRKGRFDARSAFIRLNGNVRPVCRSVAKIAERLRLGCWITRPVQSQAKGGKGKKHKSPNGKQKSKASKCQGETPGTTISVYFSYKKVWPEGWAGEHLSARVISRDTAKIENIPFFTSRLACGDMVRINAKREIVAILDHVAETRVVDYRGPEAQSEEELMRRYEEIRGELENRDIQTGLMVPGMCSISVPKDVSDRDLAQLADELGVEIVCHIDR